MHIAELVELAGTGIVILLLGLGVLSRNWRQKSLQWFFVFCLTVALWSWGLAIFGHSKSVNGMIFWADFYYVCALSIAASSQVFTSYWLKSRAKSFYSAMSAVILASFIIILLIWPHFIVRTALYSQGQQTIELSMIGYGLFSALFMIMFMTSLVRMLVSLRVLRGLLGAQTRYITLSLVCAGVFGISFNLILPWLGNYSLIWVGPLSAVIFAALVVYAIARHRLFDIRTVALRAAAYIFSTILLSLLYIVPAILLIAVFIDIHFTWAHFAWGVLVVTAFALFYSRVRSLFDSLTNRIFFRGYYEPQDILNQLSEVLVRSIDVNYIKLQSARILQRAIKSDKFSYWLLTDDDYYQRHPEAFKKLLHNATASNIFVTNEQSKPSRLVEYLRGEDVAVLVRLRAGSQILGYIALGFKVSGGAYTDRDMVLLSIAADEIAITLQNALHFEEIKNFNMTLQERVDTATVKLRQTNKKLQSLDETKDEFITMASHQLRTPLTSVKGYLSMVLEGDAGELNDNQRKLLTQSFLSSQRMVFLIADLLNLSRISTGKFVIDLKPTDLPQIVQDEIAQLVETANSRGVTLNYDKPVGYPELLLDETKIRQVIMNFIDNAIYYTPSGGEITVKLNQTPTAVECLVHDNGIGVPQMEQHRLFTKFYRAKNARKARPDGTGLGLFMAKKIIIAQGGSIIFDSVEGKGSTFGFRFNKAHRLVEPSQNDVPAERA